MTAPEDRSVQVPEVPEPGERPAREAAADAAVEHGAADDGRDDTAEAEPLPPELGGQKGPEPTRYGDWEKGGRCTDF